MSKASHYRTTTEDAENTLDNLQKQGNAVYTAAARTLARTAALYFSRPVRLFRPAKVSGWNSLKGLAASSGATLGPQYMSTLIKQQGLMVIPRHFGPPVLINTLLGVVLWETYIETSNHLSQTPSFGPHTTTTAAISGACAGGAQAFVAAPAENVRRVIESATGGSGSWSAAWRAVFLGTMNQNGIAQIDKTAARDAMEWYNEFKGMAGRGWDGYRWTIAKDICGFAAFFAIFDMTLKLAKEVTAVADESAAAWNLDTRATTIKSAPGAMVHHFPRTMHAVTLVTGGVCAGLAYEYICRPWEIARRIADSHPTRPLLSILDQLRHIGIMSFLRDPEVANNASQHRRLYAALRTLGRVGPWGIGFLVWEAFGTMPIG